MLARADRKADTLDVCPFCGRDSVVNSGDVWNFTQMMFHDTARERQILTGQFIICPHSDCKRFSLTVSLSDAYMHPSRRLEAIGKPKVWRLVPSSDAKVFPDYIPKQLRDDYAEACLIRDLSPKASATLARRCLQGMIRDFWRVTPGRLVEEIEAIKDRVDPSTWTAIEGVRSIGNIGAHMEQDVNLVIDVEPEEAAKLIRLIEILFKEWYVYRHEREEHLKQIEDIAAEKKRITKGP